jgi:hypothetical protein
LLVIGYHRASNAAETRRMMIDLRSISALLLTVILILLVICLRDWITSKIKIMRDRIVAALNPTDGTEANV